MYATNCYGILRNITEYYGILRNITKDYQRLPKIIKYYQRLPNIISFVIRDTHIQTYTNNSFCLTRYIDALLNKAQEMAHSDKWW